MYDKSDYVLELTGKNFASLVDDSNLISVVEFYAPWCGHCKALAPAFKKVAEKLEGVVTVGAVDCDNDKNKPLCGRFQVQGFPTIKIFPASKKKNPYTKKLEKIAEDYTGPRTAKGIVAAALAALPSTGVTRVRSSPELEDLKASTRVPVVLLLTDKTETSPLYKSLALRFKGRLRLAEIRTGDLTPEELAAIGGDAELPALLVLRPDGSLDRFSGKLKAKELIPYLADFAAAPGSEEDESDSKEQDPEGKAVPQLVEEIALSGLDNITASEDLYLVAYYASGPGKDCKAELKKLNEIVAGWGRLARAAAVNLTSEEVEPGSLGLDLGKLRSEACRLHLALAQFGEKGDPDEWPAYPGKLESKELQNFVVSGFPKFVTRVDSNSVQAFLGVEPSRPKVFLFTDKDETPAIFNALAANMRKYKFMFADVHTSEREVFEKFGVDKTPYMMIGFLAKEEDKRINTEGQSKLSLQRFPGPYKYPMMQAFLHAFASAINALPEEEETPEGAMFGAVGTGPVDVAEVQNNAALEEVCLKGSGLCVMAVLDSRSPSFDSHVGEVKTVAGRWSKQPLKFFWVDGPRQASFLEGWGLSSDSAPALLAFSPSKRRKLSLTGAFDTAGMHAMLDGLFSGTRTTSPFQEVPKLVDGGEESGLADAVEDEFDLADILGEEVAASAAAKADKMQAVDAELEREAKERAEAEKLAREAASKASKKKKKKKSKKAKGSTAEL